MSSTDFAKLVPGFDFLHSLMMKGGSTALPNIGQWIAPTLDPAEIDKRISELRTVQFWLEQNAKMLAATIQALEVQRMTLATLRTMNLPISQLRDSMKLAPDGAAPAAAVPTPPAPAAEPARAPAPAPAAGKKAAPAPAAAAGVVDPMQWWGALTRQFTELAANALKDAGPAGPPAKAAAKGTAAAPGAKARPARKARS